MKRIKSIAMANLYEKKLGSVVADDWIAEGYVSLVCRSHDRTCMQLMQEFLLATCENKL